MKTTKLDKEIWNSYVQEALYLKNISINLIKKSFPELPEDKQEHLLTVVQILRDKKQKDLTRRKVALSKQRMYEVVALRRQGLKYREVSEKLGICERQCKRLNEKFELLKEENYINEELTQQEKSWLDLYVISKTPIISKLKKPFKERALNSKELEYVVSQTRLNGNTSKIKDGQTKESLSDSNADTTQLNAFNFYIPAKPSNKDVSYTSFRNVTFSYESAGKYEVSSRNAKHAFNLIKKVYSYSESYRVFIEKLENNEIIHCSNEKSNVEISKGE
jgi:hypothetical protein